MNEWEPEYEDLEDREELPEDGLTDDMFLQEMEVPDVEWKEDIENIEDPEIKAEEIEAAERYLEKERELKKMVEAGRISEGEYDSRLRPERRKAATRYGLESVGLTYDQLGDISEDYDILTTGDPETMDLKQDLGSKIEMAGEDIAAELADRLLEDEKINTRQHQSLTRQARIHGK